MRAHWISDCPLLAADPTLAPWPSPSDLGGDSDGVLAADPTLDRSRTPVCRFLDAGDPPILFGFENRARAVGGGIDEVVGGQDDRTSRDFAAWLGGHHGGRRLFCLL